MNTQDATKTTKIGDQVAFSPASVDSGFQHTYQLKKKDSERSAALKHAGFIDPERHFSYASSSYPSPPPGNNELSLLDGGILYHRDMQSHNDRSSRGKGKETNGRFNSDIDYAGSDVRPLSVY